MTRLKVTSHSLVLFFYVLYEPTVQSARVLARNSPGSGHLILN